MTYTCEMCGETYERGWTDEEAAAEFLATFGRPPEPGETDAIVCDDCYKTLGLGS